MASGNMKALAFAAGTGVLAALWFAAARAPAPTLPANTPSPAATAVTADTPLSPDATLARAQAAQNAADDALARAQAAVEASDVREGIPAWTLQAHPDRQPSVELPADVTIKSVVTFAAPEQLKRVAGEAVTLPLPDGRVLDVGVERSSTLSNGDYTWSGHVSGHGTDFPVIVTIGKDQIFASLGAEDGAWSVEAIHGTGWLYKNIPMHGVDEIVPSADPQASASAERGPQ